MMVHNALEPLLTDELRQRIPAIGSAPDRALASRTVQARFHLPGREWEWYVIEFDGWDTMVGIAIHGSNVLAGRFTLTELRAISYETAEGARVGVRRDPHFSPGSVADLARQREPVRSWLGNIEDHLVSLQAADEGD